jgi:hypothetical protein
MASRLFTAAQNGDLTRLQDLITNQHIDARSTDKNNSTALHIACDWGHIECVRFLIQSGAHVNAVDNHGRSPLLIASKDGTRRNEVVELLEESGAVMNPTTEQQKPKKFAPAPTVEQPTVQKQPAVQKPTIQKQPQEEAPQVEHEEQPVKKVRRPSPKKKTVPKEHHQVRHDTGTEEPVGKRTEIKELPLSDKDLFESGIYRESEKELFYSNLRGAIIHLKSLGHDINARYMVHPETTGTVLMMHGFGMCSSW